MESVTNSQPREEEAITNILTDELKSLDLEKNGQSDTNPNSDTEPNQALSSTLSVISSTGDEGGGENPWEEKLSVVPMQKRELKTPDPASIAVSRAWTPDPAVEEKLSEKPGEDVLRDFDPLADNEERKARQAWESAEGHPPPLNLATKPTAGVDMADVNTAADSVPTISQIQGQPPATPPRPMTPSGGASATLRSIASFARSFSSPKPRPQSATYDPSPVIVSQPSLAELAARHSEKISNAITNVQTEAGASGSGTGSTNAEASSSTSVGPSDGADAPAVGSRTSSPGILTPTPAKDANKIAFDFPVFLEQLRSKGAEPVAKYLRSFLSNFAKRTMTVNDQIRVINDFLGFISARMRESDVWRKASDPEFDNATEAMEKLVMNRLYEFTFTPQIASMDPPRPVTTDDLERDRVLAQRIALFGWVEEKHLDVPEGEVNQGFLEFAQQVILKINHYKAPRDKLICILNCCKVIFGLIRHNKGDESADSFVPILIFVVLKANPPHLLSNIEFINRFRNPQKLQSEAGYYLSSLMGAVSFIETMDHTSLSNITAEEFEKNVELAIQKLPTTPPDQNESVGANGNDTGGMIGSTSGGAAVLSRSPHAGEESAQPLALPVPRSFFPSASGSQGENDNEGSGGIGGGGAASFVEDTRRFLQNAGDTISKPLSALGRIVGEVMDSAEGKLPTTYLPGPFAPMEVGRMGYETPGMGGTSGGEGAVVQTPYKPRVRSYPGTPGSGGSGGSGNSSWTGYPGDTPTRRGTSTTASSTLRQMVSPEHHHQSQQPTSIAQHLQSQQHLQDSFLNTSPSSNAGAGSGLGVASPHPSRTPTPNLDFAGIQAEIDRAHEQASAAAMSTLEQIFPGTDKEVLGWVLEANEGDLGKSIEKLLEMSGN